MRQRLLSAPASFYRLEVMINSFLRMKTFWILLCITGCVFQVSILTINYSAYEISSTVSFTFEKMIEIPAISICMRLTHLIDWDDKAIRKNCNQILPIDCSNMSSRDLIDYVSKAPLIQSMDMEANLYRLFDGYELITMSLPIESLYSRVMHELGSGTAAQAVVTGKVSDFFETIEFVRRISKCFTMRWKLNFTKVFRSSIRRGLLSPGLLWYMTPSQEFRKRVEGYSFAYSSLSNPNVGNGIVDFVMAMANATTTSSFDLFRSTLLQAPFTTDCMDYGPMGYANQIDCIDFCLSNRSLSRFRKKMSGLSLLKSDKGIKAMTMQEVAAKWDENNQISDYCLNQCPKQDCKQTIYSSRTTASVKQMLFGTDQLFYAPMTPSVVTESSEKITLTEYLVVSASCIGFWFGFSILQVLSEAAIIVSKLLACCQRNQQNPTHSQSPCLMSATRGRRRSGRILRNTHSVVEGVAFVRRSEQ